MFTFHVPTKVLFGAGVLKKLHEEKLPGKKALVVISNGKSTRTNGSLAALEAELDAAGVAHVLFDKIQANPLEPTVQEGVEFGRAEDVDFVIGLGGGSVMDAAKAIAAMIPQQGGRVWDYMATGTSEHRPFNAPLLPFVAITTSAGTGSEVDAGSVITSPVTHEKGAFFSQCPALAVVDPALMVTVFAGSFRNGVHHGISRTVAAMIVDDSARLKMRINDNGAEILESSTAQLLADSLRKTVGSRNQSVAVPIIENRLAIRKFPKPSTK